MFKEKIFNRMKRVIYFYPAALKGCRGFVFTLGVRMGGWQAGGGKKFVWAVSQKL